MQIETRLLEREGQAITNFTERLPAPQSDLARQTLKDPYLFDFLAWARRPTNARSKPRWCSTSRASCWNLGRALPSSGGRCRWTSAATTSSSTCCSTTSSCAAMW
jgi:hypothetical protein